VSGSDGMRQADLLSATTTAAPAGVSFVNLPPEDLRPNAYNPNQMGTAEFAELQAEVAYLGRCPKPIVVRRAGDQWLIVDGEHSWRAARAVGLPEVTCEAKT